VLDNASDLALCLSFPLAGGHPSLHQLSADSHQTGVTELVVCERSGDLHGVNLLWRLALARVQFSSGIGEAVFQVRIGFGDLLAKLINGLSLVPEARRK
jgi:hypothetical protein